MLGRTHNLKSARLIARRRKIIIGRTVFIILAIGILWGSIFLVSGIRAITVRNIEVFGTTSVSPANITAIAQKFLEGRYFLTISKANIFFYPKAEIEKGILQSYPEVASVALSFKSFHSIGIRVSEYKPVALWCQNKSLDLLKDEGENCYFLDDNGFIFASSTVATSTQMFIKFYSAHPKENPIGQTYLATSTKIHFDDFLNFAKGLNISGFTFSLFRERADGDFEAELATNSRLIFGRNSDLVSVLNNFETIISAPEPSSIGNLSKVDYIDLRYGNKVFYKAK